MFIECYIPNDITYKYIRSLDENDYVIIVKRLIDWSWSKVKCDYYDTEWAGQELLSLGDGERREIIQANDIEDCPTLKWFYIVRE